MWLLAEHVAAELRALRASHLVAAAEDRAAFAAAHAEIQAAAKEEPAGYAVSGGTATINVHGVLAEELDFWLWLFGYEQTAYADIRTAIAKAEADPAVKQVVFNVNSPGGNVDGLFDTTATIARMTKPHSVESKLAASAAYAIAAVGGPIKALSHASTFGSIGVVATYIVRDWTVDITSTEAPNKRPDVSTDEGKAVVREHLDQIHQLFAETIAAGRGTTVDTVNAEFGRGGVMLAAEAKKRGMVDSIAGARPGASTSRAEGGTSPALTSLAPTVAAEDSNAKATEEAAEGQPMDLKTLKAQHSDVYEAAFNEGQASERKRCSAHLKMGKKAGALDFAFKCIEDGRSFSDEDVQAEYLSAGMDRRDIANRQDDDDAVANAVDGASKKNASSEDLGDKVAALLAAEQGKKLNG